MHNRKFTRLLIHTPPGAPLTLDNHWAPMNGPHCRARARRDSTVPHVYMGNAAAAAATSRFCKCILTRGDFLSSSGSLFFFASTGDDVRGWWREMYSVYTVLL